MPKRRRRAVVQYAICITDAEPDLQPRKVYGILPDRIASKENFLRVIDESGEDYLYPDQYFVPLKLPQSAEIAVVTHFEVARASCPCKLMAKTAMPPQNESPLKLPLG